MSDFTLSDFEAPFALFDDSLSRSDQARSLLLHDFERAIVCTGEAETAIAFAQMDQALQEGRFLAVEADYEFAYWLEPKLLGRPHRSPRPLLSVHVFRKGEPLDGAQVARLLDEHQAALSARDRVCGIADLRTVLKEEDYLVAVDRILSYINAGDCYQVNYTFPLRFRYFGDPLAFYARLREAQPVHHGALLHLPLYDVLSLSPELFVERRGERLTARPMKGTAQRSTDAAADAEQRRRLAGSEKDRAENVMIVDLIRNDLGRVSRLGSVRVERLFDIEAYPSVWQMTSTVTAEAPQRTLEEIFRALFPCGSVTGAPKFRAIQIAAELERSPRGLYTGALGYVLPGGDFHFNVPIRTLVLERDGTGTLGVGSGIVADSTPPSELAECHLKAVFITKLPADFQLIETLLFDPSDPSFYPLLDDHMQRLSESARYFGFACDEQAVRDALLAHRATLSAKRQRTRLLMDKAGIVHIESKPLPSTSRSAKPCVVLARRVIDSGDIFRHHKTTVRHDYEAELAELDGLPGVFDALFCNERGELCEGARSNLYASFNGVLHTPPESVGLLNGVMRRKLLREQPIPIVERFLYPSDLESAEAIYVSNAVRGLQEACLVAREAD